VSRGKVWQRRVSQAQKCPWRGLQELVWPEFVRRVPVWRSLPLRRRTERLRAKREKEGAASSELQNLLSEVMRGKPFMKPAIAASRSGYHPVRVHCDLQISIF